MAKMIKRFGIGMLSLLMVAGCALTAPAQPSIPSETTPVTEEAVSLPLPLTPSQQEGPYYPVFDSSDTAPVERDSDLVTVADASAPPAGDRLQFGGQVLTPQGDPIPGAVVEIWQTDASGAYAHPNDPRTSSRDRNFQFYGESVADAEGNYSFTTILPGLYGGRPQHIHFKVKLDGRTLLTSQFYFLEDERIAGAGLPEAIVLVLVEDGEEAFTAEKNAEKDIVVVP